LLDGEAFELAACQEKLSHTDRSANKQDGIVVCKREREREREREIRLLALKKIIIAWGTAARETIRTRRQGNAEIPKKGSREAVDKNSR
jgi:hypothetical protein